MKKAELERALRRETALRIAAEQRAELSRKEAETLRERVVGVIEYTVNDARLRQKLVDRIREGHEQHLNAGPSREWLERAAKAEDGHEVSAGGLASAFGMPIYANDGMPPTAAMFMGKDEQGRALFYVNGAKVRAIVVNPRLEWNGRTASLVFGIKTETVDEP